MPIPEFTTALTTAYLATLPHALALFYFVAIPVKPMASSGWGFAVLSVWIVMCLVDGSVKKGNRPEAPSTHSTFSCSPLLCRMWDRCCLHVVRVNVCMMRYPFGPRLIHCAMMITGSVGHLHVAFLVAFLGITMTQCHHPSFCFAAVFCFLGLLCALFLFCADILPNNVSRRKPCSSHQPEQRHACIVI